MSEASTMHPPNEVTAPAQAEGAPVGAEHGSPSANQEGLDAAAEEVAAPAGELETAAQLEPLEEKSIEAAQAPAEAEPMSEAGPLAEHEGASEGAAAPAGGIAGPVPIVPIVAAVPAPLPYVPPVPKPRPPIIPERCTDGWKTAGVKLTRPSGQRSYFLAVAPGGHPQTIYVSQHELDVLIEIALSPNADPGKLWREVCRIPLERPLPSRQLEEELKMLLVAFAPEMRK